MQRYFNAHHRSNGTYRAVPLPHPQRWQHRRRKDWQRQQSSTGTIASLLNPREWKKRKYKFRKTRGNCFSMPPQEDGAAAAPSASESAKATGAAGAVTIQIGTTVRIHGLKSKPELNGKEGVVTAQKEARWVVQPSGEGFAPLALKETNLAVVVAQEDAAAKQTQEVQQHVFFSFFSFFFSFPFSPSLLHLHVHHCIPSSSATAFDVCSSQSSHRRQLH